MLHALNRSMLYCVGWCSFLLSNFALVRDELEVSRPGATHGSLSLMMYVLFILTDFKENASSNTILYFLINSL